MSCHIHPDWRMAAAASTTTTNLYSSFTNEPPDTVASSWPSSISRTGPDPSVARNPFQPGRSLKSKEIFFVNRRHSRTFCNPGQRRRLFSLLQDLHSAGSTQSNQFPIRIRGYHYPKVPSGTLSKLLLFFLAKSRRSKIWLKFYDLHQVHRIKIAKHCSIPG